jgi:hypothetical protein
MLRGWLAADFPTLADQLFPLCLNDSGTEPVCFSHPLLAQQAVARTCTPSFNNQIHRAYVYLASYYFCIDAIVDHHPRNPALCIDSPRIVILTGPLLSRSLACFHEAIEGHFPQQAQLVLPHLTHLLVENATALQFEIDATRSPFVALTPEEDERCIIGRANIFIFLFYLYLSVVDHPDMLVILELLRQFVIFMQFGDDLSDWRDDFRAHRWTSFLRECLSILGRIPSESELEEFIYLSGAYERRLVCVINGFSALVERFTALDQSAIATYISNERAAALRELRDITAIKAHELEGR